MKFYSDDSPELIVWDKEKDKKLCQFEKGEFVTDDKRIINILAKYYKHEGKILTPKQEVQKRASELLIKYTEKTTTKELEARISTRLEKLEEIAEQEGE